MEKEQQYVCCCLWFTVMLSSEPYPNYCVYHFQVARIINKYFAFISVIVSI